MYISVMEPLKKLTVVIPTYERHSFVLRAMKFWDNKNVSVVILDGSKNSISKNKLREFSSNLKYFHMPVSLRARLEFISKAFLDKSINQNKPYVLLQGDDEFYIPSSLKYCINELDKNKELISCCGTALGFRPVKGFGIEGVSCYTKLYGYHRSEDKNLDRAVNHMNDYVIAHLYSVVRKNEWSYSTQAFSQKEIPVFAMWELQFEMCASYAGKSKVIPHLMWLRSYGENDLNTGTDVDFSMDIHGLHFDDWWLDNNNSSEINQFLEQMVFSFTNISNVKAKDAKKEAKKIAESYVKHLEFNKKTIRQMVGNKIPFLKKLYEIIRKFLKTFKKPIEITKLSEVIKKSGVQVNKKELDEIKEILIKFHNIK